MYLELVKEITYFIYYQEATAPHERGSTGVRALVDQRRSLQHARTPNRALASRGPASVACAAEETKRRKYSSLLPTYNFAPVCIETMGAWGDSARDLIRGIGRHCHVQESTGDPRSTTFRVQRLALDTSLIPPSFNQFRAWPRFGLKIATISAF